MTVPVSLGKLLALTIHLKDARTFYQLSHHRDEAVMFEGAFPGERREVRFFENGSVEVESFTPREIEDESGLERLFAGNQA